MTATTYGTKPVGAADGTEKWATVTTDDGTTTVTTYIGWLISAEVAITANPRIHRLVVATVLRDLLVESPA